MELDQWIQFNWKKTLIIPQGAILLWSYMAFNKKPAYVYIISNSWQLFSWNFTFKEKKRKKKMNESPEFFSGPFSTFCQHIHMSDVSVQRQDTELQVFFA